MVGALLALGAAGLLLGALLGRTRPGFWVGATLAGLAGWIAASIVVMSGGSEWELMSDFRIGGEAVHLRLDGVSALFLVLLGVVGGAGAMYAREYWSDKAHPVSAPWGRMLWNGMLASIAGVLLASNGLHFLIAWELFALCSFFLITLDRRRREVRAAGWLYLAASHAGTLALFAFFALIAAKAGSWELGPQLREVPGLAPLFWLALFGFGMKAGLFPLHIWLPSAHANAPSHVSALMSGVAIKIGIYGLLRFSGWMTMPEGAGWMLMIAGAVSALLGIVFAFAQNDLKRLLAYCSVENIGIICIGIGGGMLGAAQGDAPWGRLLLAGALLHVWNHGLFKALLFLCAGSVLHATGTREMSRMGGLWQRMPWTAGLFAIGAAAVSALPPLNGFVGEWMLYLGLFDAVGARNTASWAAIPSVVFLSMSGALALASFIKAASMVFLGAPRTKSAVHAHECSRAMILPMGLLAGFCVALGLGTFLVWPAVARTVAAWNPRWPAGAAPVPLATLGLAHAALAMAVVWAAVFVMKKVLAAGVRRGPTWDCGYAAPSARMQYTGGSFSGIVAGWFGWILNVRRKLKRPRGVLPSQAFVIERTPETVLESVIEPAGRGVIAAAMQVRRLQHGRLQFYIVYLAAGIAALSVLVWLGAKP